MFFNDTGNVEAPATNEPARRFPGITAVIFELDYLRHTFEPSLLKLKERHFGLTDKGRPPILHLRQMKRAAGAFARLADRRIREEWQTACFRMFSLADYAVISVGIDKIQFY